MVGTLLRLILLAALPAALAACATAPSGRATGAVPSSLAVCSGTGVTNAPPADAQGRIGAYTPFLELRGRRIARAPVAACLSSGYGARSGGAGDFHRGLDLYTGTPRPALAGADGVISRVGEQRGFGRTVVIDHGAGVETLYAHLSSFAPRLRKGLRVSAGAVIGMTGATGNATAVHLHYELRIDGAPVDPLAAGAPAPRESRLGDGRELR